MRTLLKLSGESLAPTSSGIEGAATLSIAAELAEAAKHTQLAIVIGGGNIWRFRNNGEKTFLPRHQSDYLGMLATLMNGVALTAALESLGTPSECFTAIPSPEIATPYSIPSASRALTEGRVAILAGGTSRPYFTTDTACALRAVELSCDSILKATTVDGVYDRDPRADPTAKRYDSLTYAECLEQHLAVMDRTAFALLSEHDIPLTVFDFTQKGALQRVLSGEKLGTLVIR